MLQDTFYFNGIIFFMMSNVIIIGGVIMEYKKESNKNKEIKKTRKEIVEMLSTVENKELVSRAMMLFDGITNLEELRKRKTELSRIITKEKSK